MKSLPALAGSIFLFGLSLILILFSYLIFSGELAVWSSGTGMAYEVPRHFGYVTAMLSGLTFFFAIRLLPKAFPGRFK